MMYFEVSSKDNENVYGRCRKGKFQMHYINGILLWIEKLNPIQRLGTWLHETYLFCFRCINVGC